MMSSSSVCVCVYRDVSKQTNTDTTQNDKSASVTESSAGILLDCVPKAGIMAKAGAGDLVTIELGAGWCWGRI